MDAEGKTQTKMVDVTYADFENIFKMRQISQKTISLLLVGIFVPIIVREEAKNIVLKLSLGGSSWLPHRPGDAARWGTSGRRKLAQSGSCLTCYFDRSLEEKGWGNEITIMGRKTLLLMRCSADCGCSEELEPDEGPLLAVCGIPVWFHASIGSGGMESSVLPLMGCICVGLGTPERHRRL